MRISSCIDCNDFNQSDSNISLLIFRYVAVVYWLKALISIMAFRIKSANVDADDIINVVDDANPKEELRSF